MLADTKQFAIPHKKMMPRRKTPSIFVVATTSNCLLFQVVIVTSAFSLIKQHALRCRSCRSPTVPPTSLKDWLDDDDDGHPLGFDDDDDEDDDNDSGLPSTTSANSDWTQAELTLLNAPSEPQPELDAL